MFWTSLTVSAAQEEGVADQLSPAPPSCSCMQPHMMPAQAPYMMSVRSDLVSGVLQMYKERTQQVVALLSVLLNEVIFLSCMYVTDCTCPHGPWLCRLPLGVVGIPTLKLCGSEPFTLHKHCVGLCLWPCPFTCVGPVDVLCTVLAWVC